MTSLQHHYNSNADIRSTSTARDGGVLSKQLEYELQLQSICNELVVSYKEIDDWEAVVELERTAKETKSRVEHLKQQIKLSPNSADSSSYQDNNLESQLRKSRGKSSPPTFNPAALDYPSSRDFEEPIPSYGAGLLYTIDGNNWDKVNTEKRVAGAVEQPSAAAVNYLASGTRETSTDQNTWKSRSASPESTRSSSTYKGKQSEVGLDPADLGIVADSHHSVEELDNIEQMMESFVDDFEDLHRQSAEHTPERVLENGLRSERGSTETGGLEVPVSNKVSRASSESSGQFYSPRESPFRDIGEAEEEREFKDGNDNDEAEWQDCRSSGPKDEAFFSVAKTNFGSGEVYYVTLEQGAGGQEQSAGGQEQGAGGQMPVQAEYFESTLRTCDEVVKLRNQLNLEARFPFDSMMEGEDSDSSEEFEKFLNFVASSPSLRSSPYFLSFLSEGGEVQEEEVEETEDIQGGEDGLVFSGMGSTSLEG